ncbi:hypothetical protein MLD38_021957 [Melastoma candidum]|uniref:Uncharacterized protein n=1 Tax=Melastoma candidum TaxID=119954 RepID=A0ACB9QHK4_9MYRT|nr:hypothetical protein MLD38_021957 [Melastoma candidum]
MGPLRSSIDAGVYSPIKDLRLDFEAEDGVFCFCSWVYFLDSTAFPGTVIRLVESDTKSSAPLLVVNEEKRLLLLPMFPQKEVSETPNSAWWIDIPHALAKDEFPVGKWVHVECQVSNEVLGLHVNAELMAEQPLTKPPEAGSDSSSPGKFSLVGDGVEGCLYRPSVLPSGMSAGEHYKDLPVQLSICESSITDIEVESSGIWNIVGGKASCRRNFSLDVLLLDALAQTVDEEMEVVATLVYADSGLPVVETTDADAPLLTSFDGLEFDSKDRSSKLVKGRASFKLKISQLSSKCDNRLFCIKFSLQKAGNYPFMETLTPKIRCVSRGRNGRMPSVIIWKRPSSGCLPGNGVVSSNYESAELQHGTVHEAKPSPSSKRVRLGRCDFSYEQINMECSSRIENTYQGKRGYETSPDVEMKDCKPGNNPPSDSESNDTRNLDHKNPRIAGKYKELMDFAHQVSLYSGCSHHRNQINMTKKLIEDGTRTWGLIAQENHHVLWDSAVSRIHEQFASISGCSARHLTPQDLNLLRRIAGCQDYLTQENFQRLWCWLYPVAMTISSSGVNALWSSMSPKWIEGFITKQEAESSLQCQASLREPGTFVLHFPVSRSWPHPDAGCLVVTYVGSDYNLCHRLINMAHLGSPSEEQKGPRPLQELLLMEPDLSRLGRVLRSQ